MKNINLIPVLLFLLMTVSCKKEAVKVDNHTQVKSSIKYAKGFDIVEDNGVKKLVIKSAYQNSKEVTEYIIKNKSENNTPLENTISYSYSKNCSYFYNTYPYG